MSTPQASASIHQLNPGQYAAVHHRKGPLLVLAGAGSGKTRVITERIATLVERDVPPDAITAVTFTNKAAREMRERLGKRLGERAKMLRICTFHALGLAIVRRNPDLVGRRTNLTIFTGTEQRSVMRSVLQELGLPADAEQVERLVGRISAVKNGMVEADASMQVIRERYDTLLTRMNAVDFDDLMLLPIRILEENEEVRAFWQERARHFLVDEYQDSSRVQYDLIRLLVPPTGNLTVVGDDDQSIYGWRGAEVKNLFQLDRDYAELEVTRLEENYRSTEAILAASNHLIAHNSERLGKQLRSNLGRGKPIRIWQCPNPDEEAERVVADLRGNRASESLGWGDFCILYRSSFQARQFEMALRSADIPYHVSGGLSFFDRAEVRDTLAYLRLIANFNDDLAFIRAIARPRRGIGDSALGNLSEFAAGAGLSLLDAALDERLDMRKAGVLKEFAELIVDLEHRFRHLDADTAFDALIDQSGLERAIENESDDEDERGRRMGNIYELRRWWIRHSEEGGDLNEFLQRIFLLADKEDEDPGNQVRLMTVHAAKGLEFAHVYVVGMEEGGFPHRNAVDENRLEEERRLMYVAMTRARFRLTLSYSTSRRRFGQVEKLSPSPFLSEIGDEHVRWVDRDTGSDEAREETAAHMAEFRRRLGLE